MEKMVDLRQVQDTIRQLRERGEKISRRSVQAIVGGSMTTVHRLLDDALSAERAIATVRTSELSEGLVRAILGEIGSQVQGVTDELKCRIAELTAREQEILLDLEGSEGRGEALEQELAASRAQLAEERTTAERVAAVAVEQNAGLRGQLEKLMAENNNLVRAGEASRMEAAKALLQVERADLAAQKSEAKVMELEGRLADLTVSTAEAQKEAAVAQRHAQDLVERITELSAQAAGQIEAIQKGAATIEQLRQKLAEAEKGTAIAQHHAQGLAERVADLSAQVAGQVEAIHKGVAIVEQLRQELAEAHRVEADADKRAALVEQRLVFLEKQLAEQKAVLEDRVKTGGDEVKRNADRT